MNNIPFRNKTKVVQIGNKKIGGGNPILIQSMTNTRTEDVVNTAAQIYRLEKAGCDIVRVATPTLEAAKAIKKLKEEASIPIVADIHFDYRLAIEAINSGADKIRINPGNIGDEKKVREVVKAAKERNIPIRIGVNSGSLDRKLIEKYGGVTKEGIVESALSEISLIEDAGYDNLVISIKSSNVKMSLEAHELIAQKVNYPLHVGITEAGTLLSGTIKSSIGVGLILSSGLGDTIRISLTDEPEKEVYVGKQILNALGLRKSGVEIISCPTCGRCQIDLINLAKQVHEEFDNLEMEIKIAVMGCVVNGPGEAKEADIGIAGGNGVGIIIKRGEIIKKVPEADLLEALKEEIYKMKM